MATSNAIATAGLHHPPPSSFHVPPASFTTPLPLGQRVLIPPQRLLTVRADSKGDRGAGDTESKEVLEAFFLGKAFAEALTERLGTAVGEFLSDIGRLQAEQQKQLRDFQEEVQERARKAKLKAAQEVQADEPKARIRSSYNGTPASSTNLNNGSPTGAVPSPSRPTPAQDPTDL